MIRHERHIPSQGPKQTKSSAGNIIHGLLIPGETPLFRALARNMAPMAKHHESTLRFLD